MKITAVEEKESREWEVEIPIQVGAEIDLDLEEGEVNIPPLHFDEAVIADGIPPAAEPLLLSNVDIKNIIPFTADSLLATEVMLLGSESDKKSSSQFLRRRKSSKSVAPE